MASIGTLMRRVVADRSTITPEVYTSSYDFAVDFLDALDAEAMRRLEILAEDLEQQDLPELAEVFEHPSFHRLAKSEELMLLLTVLHEPTGIEPSGIAKDPIFFEFERTSFSGRGEPTYVKLPLNVLFDRASSYAEFVQTMRDEIAQLIED